jgi:hypothetical protein
MGLEEAIDAAVDKAEADEASGTEQDKSETGPARSKPSKEDKATPGPTPDNWLSHLEEKGVEGDKLEQSKRYYEKAQAADAELAELRSQVEALEGKDALEDYIREEYGATYTNLDELFAEKTAKQVLKMIQADIKAQAGDEPDTAPPLADRKYAELEKKFEKLQDEIFEQKMEREVFDALDELGVTGKDRDLLREYVDERWYLAPPKMQMKAFVKKCHEKFQAIRGTDNQEEGQEAEPEKAKGPKKPVSKKPKTEKEREPRVKKIADLFDGKDNAVDRALDKVLGSGAS